MCDVEAYIIVCQGSCHARTYDNRGRHTPTFK